MIILFTLDGCNVELRYPLSCDASATIRQVQAALRAKLRPASLVTIDIRNNQGMPVAPTDTVATLRDKQKAKGGAESKKAFVELYALLEGPRKSVQECMMMAGRLRKQENPAVSEDVDSSSEGVEEDDRRFTSDDDPKLKAPSPKIPGLHFIRINGKFQKGYALNNVAWAGPITTEVPVMTLVYATQMAEAVANNEKMRSRTYDPNFSAGESSMKGVDNETFSKYVSIAKTYGNLLKTGDKYGSHMALYPEISCLRHCCTPNSVFRRAIVKPFRGIVRCAHPQGLLAGEEVTALLPKVNTLIFMLLPRDRRQHLLQERYHFTCDCSRCWKANDELELTLSGAFFNGDAKTNAALQKRLTNEMREEFDNLHIFDTRNGGPVDTPIGAKIPKSPHALLQFITKYTAPDAPLKLHKNHWRISVVRIAYLKQAAFVLSSQNKEKTIPVRPFLEQRSFEVALNQLATEALFLPKGHPYYVSTYTIFKKMMAILPTNLVAALQAKSRKYAIEWESLTAAYNLWESPKAAAMDAMPTSVTGGKLKPTPKRTAGASGSSAIRTSDNNDGDGFDSGYSSDGEPIIPEEMRLQQEQLRQQYGEADLAKDDVDHDDEECEANVQPFTSENKNRENLFVAEERAAAEEAAFVEEIGDDDEDSEAKE